MYWVVSAAGFPVMPFGAFCLVSRIGTTTYSDPAGRQTSIIGNSAAEYRFNSHGLA